MRPAEITYAVETLYDSSIEITIDNIPQDWGWVGQKVVVEHGPRPSSHLLVPLLGESDTTSAQCLRAFDPHRANNRRFRPPLPRVALATEINRNYLARQ
jgi:hypothetical protein